MIARPEVGEYVSYYAGYIARVAENADVIAVMSSQGEELRKLLKSVSDAQANVRPAPGEWSIKEVVAHINDTERVFAYRAMRVARGDQTPLPGFEQNDYINATDFNTRSLADLVDEFDFQRRANVLLFKGLSAEELARQGIASGNPASVRALVYMLAGHVIHHVVSLQTDYKVGA